ncbi:hypothetical protein VaNZ11_014199 [Volvox africanus]|uniref:SGNH hydrolase-type esterase domain-containing protein n=1 Tax=Volvox africanus TaxID=51714 RepID=A0ABQ5SJA4_9CHLO|nr:hypothetical protein VaNZ11_014199 [Volvox africanus]
MYRVSQAHRLRAATRPMNKPFYNKSLCISVLTAMSGLLIRAPHTVAMHAQKDRIEGSDVKYNILAFGDSLTEGYYHAGYSYHPYNIKLNELLTSNGYSAKVHERGESGELVVGGMDVRLPILLDHFKRQGVQLSWVIILGGINDLGHRTPADAVYEGLRSLYAACHQHGARVLALTCLQMANSLGDHPDGRTQLNDLIRETPASLDYVTVLDLDKELPFPRSQTDETAALWDDILHLTPAGYDTMGRIIYGALRDLLDK